MGKVKINCDVGEGIENEQELMPYIQYCNIACGGHAGDVKSMTKMVELAIANKVKIGAHPSYPDKTNFGRKSLIIDRDKLIKTIRDQIDHLICIAKKSNMCVGHIKPHGALYNDIAKSKNLAKTFIEAIIIYKFNTTLFVPYESAIETVAIENGFSIFYEAFADRNYNDDLSLVSRKDSNALIRNSDASVRHVEEMLITGKVTSINNTKVKIKADTFCVHSDTINAISIVKELNKINDLK